MLFDIHKNTLPNLLLKSLALAKWKVTTIDDLFPEDLQVSRAPLPGGAQPAQPETFTFTKIDAKYIRMTVNSSHGGTSIGFAEIAFATGGVLDTHSVFTETSKKIYPNPSSDFIQIPELKTTENYSLHNNLGQEIKSGIVSKNEKIDIRDLADGYYYLKFKEGNAMKFIKK